MNVSEQQPSDLSATAVPFNSTRNVMPHYMESFLCQ